MSDGTVHRALQFIHFEKAPGSSSGYCYLPAANYETSELSRIYSRAGWQYFASTLKGLYKKDMPGARGGCLSLTVTVSWSGMEWRGTLSAKLN